MWGGIARSILQEFRKNMKTNTQYDSVKGVAVGRRLAEFLQKRFPDIPESRRSDEFGFSNSTVRSWYEGGRIRDDALMKLELLGCNLFWLLTGEGEMETKDKGDAQ